MLRSSAKSYLEIITFVCVYVRAGKINLFLVAN